MSYRERFEEWLDETNADRRLVLLVLVLLLVIFGSGLGTFILNLNDGETPVTRETPTVTSTPTEMPTPDGGGVGPAAPTTSTPGESDTPTDTEDPDDTDTPTPDDTPSPTATESPGGGGGGTATPAGDLVFDSNQELLAVDDAVPGDSGSGGVVVESDSDEIAELRITDVSIDDQENGITDPESSVDSSSNDGELSEHLEVRISFEDGDGNVNYLLGTDGGYQRLSDVPGETPSSAHTLEPGEQMTVSAEWRLPQSTGNEVQSDAVEFDVTFELRST